MSRATASRKPQDAASITAGLLALLTALDGAPAGSPAAGAFVAALRRRVEELAAVGGREALREGRNAAMAEVPDQVKLRAAVLNAAELAVWVALSKLIKNYLVSHQSMIALILYLINNIDYYIAVNLINYV